MNFAQLFSNKQ